GGGGGIPGRFPWGGGQGGGPNARGSTAGEGGPAAAPPLPLGARAGEPGGGGATSTRPGTGARVPGARPLPRAPATRETARRAAADRLGQGLEDGQVDRRALRVTGGRVLAEQVPVGAGVGQREPDVSAAAGQQASGRVVTVTAGGVAGPGEFGEGAPHHRHLQLVHVPELPVDGRARHPAPWGDP